MSRWRLPEFSKMTGAELLAWNERAKAHPEEFPEEGFDADDVGEPDRPADRLPDHDPAPPATHSD